MSSPAPLVGPDQIAALRTVITPGLYGAPLESSPLIDHPAVLANTGEQASAAARAQVLIRLLEEVVSYHLRQGDQTAAKILFALGEWSGVPVTERHHAVARLRSKHWTWERNYRKEPLKRDLTKVLLALSRLDHPDVVSTTGQPPPEPARPPRLEPARAQEELSSRLLAGMGRRRTAYPLDMSLSQLHDADLVVGTRLFRYHERSGTSEGLPLEIVAESLARGRTVLLLGEPGSGKSVSLYEVALRLREAGLAPLPLRAGDLSEVWSEEVGPSMLAAAETVLLVDGIDEVIDRTGEGRQQIEVLAELLRSSRGLATSRLREFETELSPLLAGADFDEIYVVAPWTVDREFRQYLQKLTAADMVDEPKLYEAVVESQELSRLVERPLYARMLTFVGERSAHRVTESAALYGEYLAKLAGAVDAANRGAGGALRIWQAAAWSGYVSGAAEGDALPVSTLELELPDLPAWPVVRRILDQLIDTHEVRGHERGEFLHYSFYEYLVARQVHEILLSRPTAAELAEALRHDLTQAIRHHLTDQLAVARHQHLRSTVLDAYRVIRDMTELHPRDRLTACSLLIYLLSRAVSGSEAALLELLEDEADTFLAIALLWGLCHLGSHEAATRFFAQLEQDSAWRSQSRGYVLYYYGDLSKDDGPPYSDDAPHASHAHSLRRVLMMLDDSDYPHEVPAPRRVIDLYTMLDILLVRELAIKEPQRRIFERTLISLRGSGMDASLINRLGEMIAMLR